MPRPAFIRLQPQKSDTPSRTNLAIGLQTARSSAASITSQGCGWQEPAQRSEFGGTLKFSNRAVRFSCSSCGIEGDGTSFPQQSFEYEFAEHSLATFYLRGHPDMLRLRLELPDGPFGPEGADRSAICGLVLDDEGHPADSTIVRGALESAAAKSGKLDIRKSASLQ